MFLSHLLPSLRIGYFTFLFSRSANAQRASSCLSTEPIGAITTGSIQIPSFQPFIDTHSSQNSTWTISIGINEVQDFSSNSYVVEQTFWLDAQSSMDTSAAALPYTGCAILLNDFSTPRISIGTNSPNSCEGVFNTPCYNAILDVVNTFILEEEPRSIENVYRR